MPCRLNDEDAVKILHAAAKQGKESVRIKFQLKGNCRVLFSHLQE
jgi:hypothetical protein